MGAFCLYLLILFVAKPAEGGASLCGLLLTVHLPPLLYPPPPRERERERDRSADLTAAVTAAAATTTAATLVMSTRLQIKPRAQALGEAV